MSNPLSKGTALACFFVVFSIITGCASTHGIAPQGKTLPGEALATDAAIRDADHDAQWPAATWWQRYADPQLDHWIDLALADNPGLAQARARVRAALAMAGAAEAAEAPQLNGELSLNRHHWPTDYFYGPGELADTTTWNNNAVLGLSYALDFWGREKNRSAQAEDLARMSAAEAQAARLELEGNIVRAYVQLSLQYASRDVGVAMLAQQEHILALARRREAGGLGTHFEVSQAEMPLPETRRKLAAIDEDIAITRNQLAALAGKGPGAAASIVRPSLSLAQTPGLPTRLPLELVGHRPDVVASRWRVAAEARSVDAAHAEFYPNIDLVASLGYSAVGGGGMLDFLTGQKFNYGAGAALSLPILDGGRRRAQLGLRSANYDAAVAQYNQTLVGALRQISDELIRARSLETQAQFSAQGMDSAREAYALAERAYRGGLTDYLHVLNAQTRLFESQLTEARVHSAQLAAQARLTIALGGGLVDDEDAPAEQELKPETVSLRGSATER